MKKGLIEFLKTASPVELYDFRDFLKGQLNCENLTFWLDIEEFRTLEEKELAIRAQSLCDIYLSESPYQLNVSSELKDEVLRKISSPTKSMFDKIQKSVIQLLAEGSYIEYMNSDRYAKLKDEKKTRLKPTYSSIALNNYIQRTFSNSGLFSNFFDIVAPTLENMKQSKEGFQRSSSWEDSDFQSLSKHSSTEGIRVYLKTGDIVLGTKVADASLSCGQFMLKQLRKIPNYDANKKYGIYCPEEKLWFDESKPLSTYMHVLLSDVVLEIKEK